MEKEYWRHERKENGEGSKENNKGEKGEEKKGRKNENHFDGRKSYFGWNGMRYESRVDSKV